MREQTMEEHCRDLVGSKIESIIHLISAENDGLLATRMMAKMECLELVGIVQAMCDHISSQPGPGQRALRAVALQDMDLEFMEAEHISAANPDPFFSASSVFDDALRTVRPPA